MNFLFGYIVGSTVTLLLLYFGHCLYQFRKPPTTVIGKTKIHSFMAQRFDLLQDDINRDFGGGLSDRLAKWQEVKYWKEAIERGVFDEDESEC
jgi:hypothetical protein